MIKVGFWKRAAAIFIDYVFLEVLLKFSLLPLKMNLDFENLQLNNLLAGIDNQQAKGFFLYIILYFWVSLIFSCIYFTYFHGSTGQTLGKKLLKIKVIQVTGEAISFKIAVIRWVGYFISGFGMFLGFLWVVFDQNKQGWHDKIAGTYVVKA